jgi:hypothetical protein
MRLIAMERSTVPPGLTSLLKGRVRRSLLGYFVPLMGVIAFCDPSGLIAVPVQFLLKDSLGLTPQQMAIFEAIVLTPAYFGFFFGWVRDTWRPTGFADHGYMLLGAVTACVCYIYLAAPTRALDYPTLLSALLAATIALHLSEAVGEAMLLTVARRERLTGFLSAGNEIAQLVAGGLAFLGGGWLASLGRPHMSFLVAGAACLVLVALGLWRPRALAASYDVADEARSPTALSSVWRSPGVVLVVTILSLWNFSPGFSTPLFYYLTSTVGLSPESFGLYRAIFFAAKGIAPLLYLYLCMRVPVARILWWSVGLNIFTGLLFFLITGTQQALIVGAVVGAMIGFGNVALFDLARRACPLKLAGTAIMLAFSGRAIASSLGDLFGAWLYENFGLFACIVVDGVTSALILPLLLRLPTGITDGRDSHA